MKKLGGDFGEWHSACWQLVTCTRPTQRAATDRPLCRAPSPPMRVAGKFHGMSSLFNLVTMGCSVAYAKWFIGVVV